MNMNKLLITMGLTASLAATALLTGCQDHVLSTVVPATTAQTKAVSALKTEKAPEAVKPVQKTTAKAAATANADVNSVSAVGAGDISAPGVNPEAIKLGLNAYNKLKAEGKTDSPYLTVVDFTQPSSDDKRLTVINVPEHKVAFQTYVAHGQGSGGDMATKFSDAFNSKESSLGVYLTGDSFVGKHGLSMHVEGLEKGINDNANARAIEMHPAKYVSADYAKANGRVGRSWGCFAVSPKVSSDLINHIKGGSVLFAYAEPEDNDAFVAA